MKRMLMGICVAIVLTACVPAAEAYDMLPAGVEPIVYPEDYVGEGGRYRVVVPPRWEARPRMGYGELTHREYDASVYVFSGTGESCQSLIAQRLDYLDFPLVALAMDPARGGRVHVITYDTGDPTMHCQAYARYHEGRWYVAVCRVAESDLDARFLYVNRILAGFCITRPTPAAGEIISL